MPTNRRRIDRARGDVLNINQEGFLHLGFDCFPGYPGFEDEDRQREAWEANRERLMAGYDRPGRRPWAHWRFDWDLEEGRDAKGWRTFVWPSPIQSEEEMVYDLLKRGKLKSCKFNGAIRIESELRVIRENWLNEIRIVLGNEDCVPKITGALPTWGTPVWFYEEHAPRIWAEMRPKPRKPAGSLG
jgi:hypothetical protein